MYSNRPRRNWGIIAVVSVLGISNLSLMNNLVSHKLKNPFPNINLPVGPLSVGYQKKGHQALDTGTSTAESTKAFYRDDVLGVAYAVNDDFAISYNVYESVKHLHSAGTTVEQETKAINVAYTVGGLTLGFQDASTDNANQVKDAKDDTRRIQVTANF